MDPREYSEIQKLGQEKLMQQAAQENQVAEGTTVE
jgi:hypothetical protein